MAKQKPPDSAGKLTGFPYSDCWEEFGEAWEPLRTDGSDRVIIERSFKWAKENGAEHFWIGGRDISRLLRPLKLEPIQRRPLVKHLYYLAGHYLAPEIRKLQGDAPAQVRRMMLRISSTAAKLEDLMAGLSAGVERQMRGARWKIGPGNRKSDPDTSWLQLARTGTGS